MIIDGLTHITSDGRWIDGKSDASLENLLQNMEEARIEKAIVCGLPEGISSEGLASITAPHAARFFIFSAPPIHRPADLEPWFENSKKNRTVGIKIHPREGKYSLDAREVSAAVDLAVRRGMPILLCGFPGGSSEVLPHQVLGKWADCYPEGTFILAHAGSHRILDAWHMARSRENVYLDLSHTLSYYLGSSVEKDIGFVARRLDKRVLFGSDFPEYSPAQAIQNLERCLSDWPDADRAAIYGGNWKNILLKHQWWKDQTL